MKIKKWSWGFDASVSAQDMVISFCKYGNKFSGSTNGRIFCFSLQHGYHSNPITPKLQHTSDQEQTTDVVIQQNSRKLLMMDILMSETCWAHKKWNKNSKWHQIGL